jgi:hypothetical protein
MIRAHVSRGAVGDTAPILWEVKIREQNEK